MDPFGVFGMQEYQSSRKLIAGEPSKEKEQSNQYSPKSIPSLPASPRDSPKPSDYKKRKRGRPPLEKDSRLCTNCGTAETPEWRKGPLGPHTLCNACGLQWMKSQKRESETRSKMEEARKKNSVMRVLHSHSLHGNIFTREQLPESTMRSSGSYNGGVVDMSENSGELSSRYSPEMDTLPSDISPTISPSMQAIQTPLTLDAINTLKAMQTLSTLSQMNQMNHINTLNHLHTITNNNETSLNTPPLHLPPSPSHYNHGHTVINHYNTNLSTYNNNSFSLSPDMAAPMSRFPPLNPQQVFLPMGYNTGVMNAPPHPLPTPPQVNPSPYSPYLQQVPLKDYTSSSLNMHAPPNPHLSITTPPHYSHYQQVHSNSFSLLHSNSHNLIPNPMAAVYHQQHNNHNNNNNNNYKKEHDDDDSDEASYVTGL